MSAEEQLKAQLGDMMLQAMNNKAEILAELMVNMESLSTMGRGLTNFEDSEKIRAYMLEQGFAEGKE